MNSTKIPNFFVAGFPRCGTSSLHAYLRPHPEIFMPEFKEPIYFCKDLVRESLAYHGSSKSSAFHVTVDEHEYLEFFQPCDREKAIGEASGWYLYSKVAAEEIAAFNPESRVFVLLRDPVDILYSLHSQLRYAGHETIDDFGEALDAESDRREGKRLNPHMPWPSLVYYSEVTRFVEQIQRYRERFSDEQIKYVVYEDLRDKTAEVYHELLVFLGVSTDFQPQFRVVHGSKVQRFPIPFKPLLKKYATRTFSRDRLSQIAGILKRYNTVYTDRKELDPRLRQRLMDQHREIVRETSEIVGRDLGALWGY